MNIYIRNIGALIYFLFEIFLVLTTISDPGVVTKQYYLENNPRGFCKELIDSSVKFWEKEDVVIDDITVVTIFFW